MAILAKYTKRELPVVEATYDLFLHKAKIYNKNGRPDAAGIDRLLKIMVDQNIIKPPQGGAQKYILPLEKVGYSG